MIETPCPRWAVTYRPKHAGHNVTETTIDVEADSIIRAIKIACGMVPKSVGPFSVVDVCQISPGVRDDEYQSVMRYLSDPAISQPIPPDFSFACGDTASVRSALAKIDEWIDRSGWKGGEND